VRSLTGLNFGLRESLKKAWEGGLLRNKDLPLCDEARGWHHCGGIIPTRIWLS